MPVVANDLSRVQSLVEQNIEWLLQVAQILFYQVDVKDEWHGVQTVLNRILLWLLPWILDRGIRVAVRAQVDGVLVPGRVHQLINAILADQAEAQQIAIKKPSQVETLCLAARR